MTEVSEEVIDKGWKYLQTLFNDVALAKALLDAMAKHNISGHQAKRKIINNVMFNLLDMGVKTEKIIEQFGEELWQSIS